MIIRGEWRDFPDDPSTSGPFPAAVVLVAAVVFGVVCLADVAMLLAALVLRFLRFLLGFQQSCQLIAVGYLAQRRR